MDYERNFNKFLKRMDEKKIDWNKKNSWETDIENSINKNQIIEFINNCLFK